jgi:serpin B
MHKTGEYNYNEDQNYQMIELPFDGKKVSMVIVLPKDNNQAATGQIPTYDNIKTLLAGSAQQEVVLTLPKFSFNRISDVVPPLQSMGMKQAFMPPPVANFSGIDGTDSLYVSNIFHQAFVAVDEKGTTAAAATAVVLGVGTCVAPVQHNYFYFTANHPFFFFIRDIPTGQILFIGYMLTPTTASQPIAYRD